MKLVENFFYMNHNQSITHWLSFKTLGICLGTIGLVVVLIVVFNLPISTAAFILICPAMHLLMMKTMGHKHK